MIFIKKTSKLFAKKDTKSKDEAVEEEVFQEAPAASDSLNDADAVWEPKTEEELKQKALILKIRELLGEDTGIPIKVSDIKKLEAEKLEEEKKAWEISEAEKRFAESQSVKPPQTIKDDGDEIWEPKTEEEILQHASMLKIRELLGQDTSIPIKKSEVTKTEVINFVPPKPIVEEIVATSADAWVPQTEDEKRQQAAILKIRELLGEDTTVPIKKQQQVKTQMVGSMGQQEEPVKRDPKAIIRCGEEEEEDKSAQYLLLKKLLEENDKTDAKRPAGGGKSGGFQPAVSSFGIGNAFTIGAIRNAEPTSRTPKENLDEVKSARTSPQAAGSVNYFSVGAVINAEPVKENKKEEKAFKTQIKEQLKHVKVHSEEQEYKRPPEAKNPSSGFFMFDFKELIK